MDHFRIKQMVPALVVVFLFLITAQMTAGDEKAVNNAANLVLKDAYTLVGQKDLLRDYPAVDSAGNVNVVVEIPTGTNEKWEVDEKTGEIKWELVDGKPRIVAYLGYPGNYGMVPGTVLPKELGGDGDPLDVLVLGPAVPRGSVVKVRLLGVLRMLDRGEKDDKLIAVMPGSPLGDVSGIAELDQKYRGVTTIVETWFSNYKGPGKIETSGFGNANEARKILDAAISAFGQEP